MSTNVLSQSLKASETSECDTFMTSSEHQNDNSENNRDSMFAIIQEHEALIRSILLSKIPGHVDDLFQDLCVSLATKPLPPDVRNVKSYLRRAINNDIMDLFRKLVNSRERLQQYATDVSNGGTKGKPDYCPQAMVMRKDQLQYVFKLAKEQLPAHLTHSFILRYKYNCDISEISKTLGVPKRVVSVYLSNARKQVRLLLETKGITVLVR